MSEFRERPILIDSIQTYQKFLSDNNIDNTPKVYQVYTLARNELKKEKYDLQTKLDEALYYKTVYDNLKGNDGARALLGKLALSEKKVAVMREALKEIEDAREIMYPGPLQTIAWKALSTIDSMDIKEPQ